MTLIRSIRFILEHKGIKRKIFKLALGQKDASVYMFPYGKKGEYYFGSQTIERKIEEKQFKYNKQFYTYDIPKLSYHQSGQVKICDSNKDLSGPINTIPLNNLKGEHIATVTIDNFENLPIYNKNLKLLGADRDHLIKSDNIVKSGRIIIYCNAKSKNFKNTKPCNLIISMKRPDFEGNFCFEIRGQKPLSNELSGGIIIIAGFNPTRKINEKQEFLFIRAL